MVATLLQPHIACYDYRGTLRAGANAGNPGNPGVIDNAGYADFFPGPSGGLAIIHGVGRIDRLEFPEGHVLHETPGWLSHARVSPDGQRVAFYEHPVAAQDQGQLLVVDRAGKTTVLAGDLTSALGLAWSPRGDEVWFTAALKDDAQRALRAVSLGGRARLLLATNGNLKLEDVSKTGGVLLTQPQHYLGLALTDGAGETRDLSYLDQPVLNDVSRDGSMIVFSVEDAAGRRSELYMRRTDGTAPVALGRGRTAAFSPDGNWIVRVPLEPSTPLALLPTGAGAARELPAETLVVHRVSVLPEGQGLVLLAQEPGRGVRLYRRPLDGGASVPIGDEGISPLALAVSPGGDVVVVAGPQQRVTLFPARGGAPVELPEVDGAAPLGFLDDGALLVAPSFQSVLQVDRFELATRAHALQEVCPGAAGSDLRAGGRRRKWPVVRLYPRDGPDASLPGRRPGLKHQPRRSTWRKGRGEWRTTTSRPPGCARPSGRSTRPWARCPRRTRRRCAATSRS